jgi:hypothetical protein
MGAALAVGLSALVYEVLPPKKGSVEWHKKEYREARARLAGARPFGFIQRTYARITRNPAPALSFEEELRLRQKELSHERVLLEKGFLAKCAGFLEGPDAGATLVELRSKEAKADYTRVTLRTLNPRMFVEVIAPASELAEWEALIRKASLPQSGN